MESVFDGDRPNRTGLTTSTFGLRLEGDDGDGHELGDCGVDEQGAPRRLLRLSCVAVSYTTNKPSSSTTTPGPYLQLGGPSWRQLFEKAGPTSGVSASYTTACVIRDLVLVRPAVLFLTTWVCASHNWTRAGSCFDPYLAGRGVWNVGSRMLTPNVFMFP
jgi:hypothetical protein